MIETQVLTINGLEVYYLLKRSANPKADVVFIHGFPFSSAIWSAQLPALPEEVQGIAYDIRGFGHSRGGHSYFSIDLFARDLLEFIRALSLDNVVLCGVSMGGYIALRAMEISPGQIGGLILCDTNASADPNDAKVKRFASIEQVLKEGNEVFADNFIKNLFSDKTLSERSSVPEFIRNLIVSTQPETICSAQLALASRTDTSAMLPGIKAPVLIIRGEEDRLMTQQQAGMLREAIPGSDLQVIPEAGHLPNCESFEIFNAHLNNYLRKHFLS